MSAARKELRKALSCYTEDTLIYIDTARRFCNRLSKWLLRRETELNMMMDIKDRVNNINLNISHVTKSEEKAKAFKEYMTSKVTQVTADGRRAELEKELAEVLKDTLGGMEELDRFLDAVEKLAVTSLHVFMEENQVLHLPEGIILEHVQVVITAARLICPLLLYFKRDASVFFIPKLQNVEVLAYQLDKYIQSTQKICEKLEKSNFSDSSPKKTMETVVQLHAGLSEDDVQWMLNHIKQLDGIRRNQPFRMVFLFRDESGFGFIKAFGGCQPRMLQFLKELEEAAVQVDRMNYGAKISSVTGSSVGVVGGVLSIVGLALIPVTLGASLALTMTGIGLGITSGVNSAVTTATEIGVNRTQLKKANELFQSFMQDVQILQNCLQEAIEKDTVQMQTQDLGPEVGKVLLKSGLVVKGVDGLVDGVSAVKWFKSEQLIADIPDVGQAALKGPLALSKTARAGLMAANALFIGMDIFFICKDSISLAKGSEAEMSQFIRARAALFSSEMDSWQKIHDALCEGLQQSEKNQATLKMSFYPEIKDEATELEEKHWCKVQ